MGERVKTYREVALEQAVISHGRVVVPMSLPHSNYRAPNLPGEVVKAAIAYERFLDRSWREAEEMADRLAVLLTAARPHVPTSGTVDNPGDAAEDRLWELIATALDEHRAWTAAREDLF